LPGLEGLFDEWVTDEAVAADGGGADEIRDDAHALSFGWLRIWNTPSAST
jgi:hypothetical protein